MPLTEIEQLKLDNAKQTQTIIQLQFQVLQQQANGLNADAKNAADKIAAVVAEIGTAHPELVWNAQRAVFVERPKEATPPAAA